MIKYYKFIENGYIVSVIKTPFSYDNGISISKDEYDYIQSIIKKRPDLKDGCGRRLNEKTMEWEYYELPPQDEEPSDTDDDAIESDYIDALNTLGVDTNEEN